MVEMALDRIVENRLSYLAELRKRQAVLRDYVRAVVQQYVNGLYLHGRPGTAKTHTVRPVLEQEIREIYVYQQREDIQRRWGSLS
jgi:predicted ATPase